MSSTQPKAPLNARQRLIKDSAQRRIKSQQLAFSWQERIFAKPKVSAHMLRQAAAVLQPQTYDEIVEERVVQDWCGYPLCDREPQKDQPRYRISLSQRKVFDQSELASYCSEACMQKSKYFRMQLSEDPVWIRDLQTVPAIQIILPDQDLQKVLAKEKEQSSRSGQQIRNDYVQQLLANVPQVSQENNELQIVEKVVGTQATVPTAGVHDAIEGYRIEVRRGGRKTDQPTTMILPKPPGSTPDINPNDEQAVFDDAMETMMMLKELKLDQPDTTPTSPAAPAEPAQQNRRKPAAERPKERQQGEKKIVIVAPERTAPKPKKKTAKPEMSLFGKIWTMTDRLTTKATRRYLEELRRRNTVDVRELLKEEQQDLHDEISLMRGQIFSERILETYSLLRSQLGLRDALEKDLMDLIRTFRFADASMVVLDTSQAYMMTLVLFKALADVAVGGTEWRANFEACCSAIGESGDTIDACVRVLRVAST